MGKKESPSCVFRRGGPYLGASKTVSRVLYLTVIYLDALLPVRSSHPGSGRANLCAPMPVLLRIEFTAMSSFQSSSELLPHFSTLTMHAWRYISVALVRGSPLAGVTRYPCPMEPGLSSRTDFRLVPAAARLGRRAILPRQRPPCQLHFLLNF